LVPAGARAIIRGGRAGAGSESPREVGTLLVRMKVKTLLLLLALALPAAADEVVLKNGAAFSGVVREEGERVVLELDFGTMTFKKSEVRSVKKTTDPIKEYEQKLQAAIDAKGYYDVAVWAREKGLATRANDLFRKVVSLSPDHEGARKALGHDKVDGRWLEGDDLLMARGLLKHNGRWLPKDTVEKIQENEKHLAIETDRRQTEEKIARLRHDVAMAKVAVERERLERERLERERAESDWWRWQWSTGRGSSWPRWCGVITLPPPIQNNVQPAPVVIQGPGTTPSTAPKPGPARP
jgi:hypothetical protein